MTLSVGLAAGVDPRGRAAHNNALCAGEGGGGGGGGGSGGGGGRHVVPEELPHAVTRFLGARGERGRPTFDVPVEKVVCIRR